MYHGPTTEAADVIYTEPVVIIPTCACISTLQNNRKYECGLVGWPVFSKSTCIPNLVDDY